MATTFAWVIERYSGDTLMYWCSGPLGGFEGFSKNNGDAIRFARRQDAECILHRHLGGIGRAVEHGWEERKKFGPLLASACDTEHGK